MGTVRVSVRATASYELTAETFLVLMVEPLGQGAVHTVVSERLLTTPTPYSEIWFDESGNLQRRLLARPGVFSFDYTATFDTAPNAPVQNDAREHLPQNLPPETLIYTRPSRYCPSDKLARMASDLFGAGPGGGARVNAIADWVRRNVEYRYGTSDASTSALETVVERVGVCRDFAHLVISFCRALGIPARYVSGYALGLRPCDFHGYVQAFVGGVWHNVDATFDGVRPALVPIGFGRDAADLAMLTLFGTGVLREQSVEVYKGDGQTTPGNG